MVASPAPSWVYERIVVASVRGIGGGEGVVHDLSVIGRTGEARDRLLGVVRSTISRARLVVDWGASEVVIAEEGGLGRGESGGLGDE